MEKIYRWAATHKLLVALIFDVIAMPVWTHLLLGHTNAGIGLVIVVDSIILCIGALLGDSCLMRLTKKPLSDFDDACDPYPLLEETEKLLACNLKGNMEQVTQINRLAALSVLGKYDVVYDTLMSLNIDKYSGCLPMNKVVYYHNLASACDDLGRHDEASAWRSKMNTIYNDMPENRMKKSVSTFVLNSRAEELFYSGRYQEALEMRNSKGNQKLRYQVADAFAIAKIYIKLGDKEKARENLEFVIKNGNKLYVVTEAKELMKEL